MPHITSKLSNVLKAYFTSHTIFVLQAVHKKLIICYHKHCFYRYYFTVTSVMVRTVKLNTFHYSTKISIHALQLYALLLFT